MSETRESLYAATASAIPSARGELKRHTQMCVGDAVCARSASSWRQIVVRDQWLRMAVTVWSAG